MFRVSIAILVCCVIAPCAAAASTITYSSQATFQGAIGASVLDTYTAAGYSHGNVFDGAFFDVFTDAGMSAVFGETVYRSTGISNNDIIFGENTTPGYCAGCNGSFELTFTSTTVGNATGIYGVGLNFNNEGGPQYYATVTFGDNSVANYLLPLDSYPTTTFWGITSDTLINHIDFGLINGGTTINGSFGIESLQIAAAPTATAPEPATLTLTALGLAGALTRYRRRRS